MTILALDPGTEQTGYCFLENGAPIASGVVTNEAALVFAQSGVHDLLACEWIESYGMSVGKEVFVTCRWIGRFEQACRTRGDEFRLVTRREVKLALCNSSRAKDPNVRQALIDRFGGSKENAIGVKAKPGPLYGVKSHAWSALAVAVVADDQIKFEQKAA